MTRVLPGDILRSDLEKFLRCGTASVSLIALVASGSLFPAKAGPTQVAQVQNGGTVREIRIEGAERIEPETIRSYLQVQPGDDFQNGLVEKSLKALFASGLFADVVLSREDDALIVKVVENPVINMVAFEGNSRFDDKALNDEVQLKARSVYTRTRVQADVKRILDLYRRSGRFAATVEPKIIQLPQNRVNLVFEIVEGKLTEISSINFVGNKIFENGELQAVISTKVSRFYRFFSSDDTYDPDRLTFDRELLRKFYLSKGYADFRVISSVAELNPTREGFLITFTVEEGEQYQYGKIDLNVALKDLKATDLMPLLLTKQGMVYNAEEVDNTIMRLTSAVGDKGYAFVDIRPQITRNKETHTLDVTYEIAEGPRVYVERIDITGNVKTLDSVIRREFTIAEGDAFSSSKVKRSETNLKNLGFFKKVDVSNVAGSQPDRTIINVEVEEQSTGSLMIGTGFSTSDGILGNVGIQQRNLLGRGQDLRFNGTLSSRTQLLDLSFTEPFFTGRPIAAGVDLFQTRSNNQRLSNFDQFSLGSTFRLGFDLAEDLRSTTNYTVRQDRITNVSSTASLIIQNQRGARLQSTVGESLLYDQRDNRLAPTDGYYLQYDQSIAGLGGSVFYSKSIFSGGYYYTVAPKFVASVVSTIGVVQGLDQKVRIQDRFFIGGDTLRGFADSGIGPRDQMTRDSLGANKYFTTQFELSIPLGLPEELGVGGRLFTDVGTAFGIDDNRNTKTTTIQDSANIRLSSGFGVSYKSPLGPIKVDFGVPLLKKNYDEREVIRVNFGTRF